MGTVYHLRDDGEWVPKDQLGQPLTDAQRREEYKWHAMFQTWQNPDVIAAVGHLGSGSADLPEWVEVSYFTFDVNGRQTGLIRRVRDTKDELLQDERLDTEHGGWIGDPGLAHHHYGEGYELVEIDFRRAAEIAATYRTSLLLGEPWISRYGWKADE